MSDGYAEARQGVGDGNAPGAAMDDVVHELAQGSKHDEGKSQKCAADAAMASSCAITCVLLDTPPAQRHEHVHTTCTCHSVRPQLIPFATECRTLHVQGRVKSIEALGTGPPLYSRPTRCCLPTR